MAAQRALFCAPLQVPVVALAQAAWPPWAVEKALHSAVAFAPRALSCGCRQKPEQVTKPAGHTV
jgi:hypothetical protein